MGKAVKSITVKNLVMDDLIDNIQSEDYFICMSEECKVAYYNSNTNIIYDKSRIKVPIWFKNDANPKYICYCNTVTETQIYNAVIKDGAKDMKDVIRLTGAMKNGKCKTNNPMGTCCSSYIQEVINKALNDLG